MEVELNPGLHCSAMLIPELSLEQPHAENEICAADPFSRSSEITLWGCQMAHSWRCPQREVTAASTLLQPAAFWSASYLSSMYT